MVSYWPSVLDNPDVSEAERDIAQRCADGIPITVVSDSITDQDTGPWREQTTIASRDGAVKAATEIRESTQTAVIFGSQTLVAHLLQENLIDQLSMMIGPKLVAEDRPVFGAAPMTQLQLPDVTRYPDSENVVLTYTIQRSSTPHHQ